MTPSGISERLLSPEAPSVCMFMFVTAAARAQAAINRLLAMSPALDKTNESSMHEAPGARS